ncbi:MAG: hypothetical protein JJT81_02390 [Rubellimicrobium sp.]|nr:hypothetical protein [Rubellimicrobium sp.]
MPGFAAGQTVTFRSGEHAVFSRLVLDIPIGADWEILPVPGGYRLQMDREIEFDTRRAFDRIPRTRLSELATDSRAGALDLRLDCDCFVTAFLFRPDKLVIDINDGPPPEGLPSRRSELSASGPVQGSAQVRLPDILPLGDPPRFMDAIADNPFAPQTDALSRILRSGSGAALSDQVPRQRPDTALEARLRDSFAAALDDGFLDPRPDRPALPHETAGGANDPHLSADPDPPLAEAAAALRGLRIETAQDPVALGLPRQTLANDGAPCLDDHFFDLASWGDHRPFAEQMSEHAQLASESAESLSSSAIEKLARLYLYFGFGDESLQLLALDGVRSVDREVLAAIARVLDDRPQGGATPLAGQEGCTGTVALWAVLARGSLANTTDPERTAAATAQRLLPSPIRAQVGLRLSELFLDMGDPVTAARILDDTGTEDMAALARAGLVEAEIVRQVQGPGAAVEHLARLAETEVRLTANGLAGLIELSLTEGKAVSDETLLLAAATRSEMRNLPEVQRLAVAEFRTLVSSRRFDDAITFLEVDFDPLDMDIGAELAGELYEAMAEVMQDGEFLTLAFSPRPADPGPRAENAIARRLLELGFLHEAESLASLPAVGNVMAERRHLRAELALAREMYGSVATILGGMQGARAEALRAQAREALEAGEPQDGIALPAVQDAETAALPNTAEFPPFPERRGEPGATDSPELPPLAAGRAMLDEAGALRERALSALEDMSTDRTPAPAAF